MEPVPQRNGCLVADCDLVKTHIVPLEGRELLLVAVLDVRYGLLIVRGVYSVEHIVIWVKKRRIRRVVRGECQCKRNWGGHDEARSDG